MDFILKQQTCYLKPRDRVSGLRDKLHPLFYYHKKKEEKIGLFIAVIEQVITGKTFHNIKQTIKR